MGKILYMSAPKYVQKGARVHVNTAMGCVVVTLTTSALSSSDSSGGLAWEAWGRSGSCARRISHRNSCHAEADCPRL
jgi:hypothetical protein